mmetsp:Transcript_20961/g.30860  ORF Transcript_20961/g.30860 Transcript_20961/m.30860 type:complete len:88 (-) Transcript_20961:442-705(-)
MCLNQIETKEKLYKLFFLDIRIATLEINDRHDCKVPQSKGYSCRHKTVETKDLVYLKQHMVATWQKWRSSRDTMTNTNRRPALIGVR